MTSRDFAYWLQGFFEIADPKELTPEQTELVKKHLALVFFHEIDPSYSKDPKIQLKMNNIHSTGSEETSPHLNKQKDNNPGELYRC